MKIHSSHQTQESGPMVSFGGIDRSDLLTDLHGVKTPRETPRLISRHEVRKRSVTAAAGAAHRNRTGTRHEEFTRMTISRRHDQHQPITNRTRHEQVPKSTSRCKETSFNLSLKTTVHLCRNNMPLTPITSMLFFLLNPVAELSRSIHLVAASAFPPSLSTLCKIQKMTRSRKICVIL